MVATDDPRDLAGQELSAVAFVRDYVEFHFDGPVLRALSHPILRRDGEEFQFPAPGSRDALCSLIGQVIESLRVIAEEGSAAGDARIELTTRTATVVIPLDRAHRVGPEAAHYVPCHPDGSPRVEGMRVW